MTLVTRDTTTSCHYSLEYLISPFSPSPPTCLHAPGSYGSYPET